MELHLDPQSRIPIYLQLVEQINGLVAAGKLQPGQQLPTVREVAAELRVNFNTVARAYRLLHDEGVISSQQGRGTYVLERAASAGSPHLRQQQARALAEAWVVEAKRLGLTPDEVERAWDGALDRWVNGAPNPEER